MSSFEAGISLERARPRATGSMIATMAVLFMKALKKAATPQKISKVERRPPPAARWINCEICRTPPDFSSAVQMINSAPIVRGASFLKTLRTVVESTNPNSTVQQRTLRAMRSDGATSLRNANNVTTMSNKVRIMGRVISIARPFVAATTQKASTECATQHGGLVTLVKEPDVIHGPYSSRLLWFSCSRKTPQPCGLRRGACE